MKTLLQLWLVVSSIIESVQLWAPVQLPAQLSDAVTTSPGLTTSAVGIEAAGNISYQAK